MTVDRHASMQNVLTSFDVLGPRCGMTGFLFRARGRSKGGLMAVFYISGEEEAWVTPIAILMREMSKNAYDVPKKR